jgi:hypothetical protein
VPGAEAREAAVEAANVSAGVGVAGVPEDEDAGVPAHTDGRHEPVKTYNSLTVAFGEPVDGPAVVAAEEEQRRLHVDGEADGTPP